MLEARADAAARREQALLRADARKQVSDVEPELFSEFNNTVERYESLIERIEALDTRETERLNQFKKMCEQDNLLSLPMVSSENTSNTSVVSSSDETASTQLSGQDDSQLGSASTTVNAFKDSEEDLIKDTDLLIGLYYMRVYSFYCFFLFFIIYRSTFRFYNGITNTSSSHNILFSTIKK